MPEYRPKKKKKSRAGSVALSLLVFVLFLAIFGGVFLWAIINNRLPTDGASSAASEEAGPHFTGEDVRWLFIAAQDGSEPRGFVAVRADPQNGRIHAVAVPKETEVADGTTLIRLDELFRKNGVAAAQAAVGNLLGVSFPHYVSMTYANIEKLLQYFDSSLQFTLTEDLDCREGDYFIKMNSGRYTLTPKQAVDILRYPSWQHKGLQQQADIHAEMLAALVNQYMTGEPVRSGFQQSGGAGQNRHPDFPFHRIPRKPAGSCKGQRRGRLYPGFPGGAIRGRRRG